MSLKNKEEFEKDKTLIAQYGNYEAYQNANKTPTLDDYVSVDTTGNLPTTPQQTPTDDYRQQYTDAYNQMVEKNNAVARNRALASGAEYRDIVRNVNEINKVKGNANTGYAGDTSIDAYNAYRNSVMDAYNEANSSNNELYRYYLDNMAKERTYQDDKETKVLSEVEGIIASGEKYTDGRISGETLEKVNEYLKTIYGENVPSGIKAYLGTQLGYNEYMNDSTNYGASIETLNDEVDFRGVGDNKTIGDDYGDNFKIKIGDDKYELQTARPKITQEEIDKLAEAINKTGQIVSYKGEYYTKTEKGKVVRVTTRDDKVPTFKI